METKEKWLQDRKTGIGGSDIGVILGLNPKKTPYQLWAEKTGRVDGSVDNNFTRAGVKLEPMVADWFRDETGYEMKNPGNEIMRHNVHEFVIGTPDRVVMNLATKERGVLEIKTTGQIIDQDNPPLSWFCQANWYAGIIKSHGPQDYTVNHLAWFERLTCAFHRLEYDYDPTFVDFMVNKAGEFWLNYIQADTPPPPVNGADVANLYRQHQPGKLILATDDLREKIDELKNLRALIKEQEEAEKKLIDMLQIVMGDAESIVVDGIPVVTWKTSKDSTKFDAKAFQETNPKIYKQFLIQTPGSRRFLVK